MVEYLRALSDANARANDAAARVLAAIDAARQQGTLAGTEELATALETMASASGLAQRQLRYCGTDLQSAMDGSALWKKSCSGAADAISTYASAITHVEELWRRDRANAAGR